MSKMKREQGVNNLIQPNGEGKRGSLDCENRAIRLLEFLGVPGSQSLCNLLFVGEELIQGAWRDPRLSGNTIGVCLVVAHFGKDSFSSIKNRSDALDPSRSSLNRLCVFPLIHTIHQTFVLDSPRLRLSLVSPENLLTTRVKTRIIACESE